MANSAFAKLAQCSGIKTPLINFVRPVCMRAPASCLCPHAAGCRSTSRCSPWRRTPPPSTGASPSPLQPCLLQLLRQRARCHSAAVIPSLQGSAREIRPQPGTTRAVERARRFDRFAAVCVSPAARVRPRLALTRAHRSALLQRAGSPLLLGRCLVCSSSRQRGVTGMSEHPERLSLFARACRAHR